MNVHAHPFGYTQAMQQTILATGIIAAIFAIPLTVQMFATSAFADSFYGLAYSLI